MKKILFLFVTISSLCSAFGQFNQSRFLSYVYTKAELRAKPPGGDSYLILVGVDSLGDGKAGFGYYYDSSSTATEDTVTMNVIQPTGASKGRWLRSNAKVVINSWGTMINNNGLIEYFTSGTLDANGKITVNLTNKSDTTTGTPIYKMISDFSCVSITKAPTVGDVIKCDLNDYGGTLTATSFNGKWMRFIGVKQALVYVSLINLTVRLGDVAAASAPVLIHIVGR